MEKNIPLLIAACFICILIGFFYWPAFILSAIILLDLVNDPRKSKNSKPITSENSSNERIVKDLKGKNLNNFNITGRPSTVTAMQPAEVPKNLRRIWGKDENLIATQKNQDSEEIRLFAEKINVPHLVHFTRCDNLPSILRHGLRSVKNCRTENIEPIRNDLTRLDGQLDGTSLSISFPNYRMFFKYRQMNPNSDWAVLILSRSILWEKRCGFYRFNAADTRARKIPREFASSSKAFREMFQQRDIRRELWLRAYDTSDPQAEVMVYEQIEPRFIETVAFETKPSKERWSPVLGGIDAIYAGKGKGLFGSRSQVRLN